MKVKKAQATAVAGGKDTTSGCKDVILRENIIVIASEMHYDSFWWKMMFMATGIAAAQGAGGGARSAHKMTVAYVDVGYTNHEKLALEALKSGGVNLLKVKSKDNHQVRQHPAGEAPGQVPGQIPGSRHAVLLARLPGDHRSQLPG